MTRREQWFLIDNFKRKYFLKKEIKYKILKFFKKNDLLPLLYKYFFFFLKTKFNHFFFPIQYNNRCQATSRIKGIVRFVKISRYVFRKKSYYGELPGFKRSSW